MDDIHGWKLHPWMTSTDEQFIHGCHPWMKKFHPWMKTSSMDDFDGWKLHPWMTFFWWMKISSDVQCMTHILFDTYFASNMLENYLILATLVWIGHSVHSFAPCCIALNCITLDCLAALHCVALHCTALLSCTALCCITLWCITSLSCITERQKNIRMITVFRCKMAFFKRVWQEVKVVSRPYLRPGTLDPCSQPGAHPSLPYLNQVGCYLPI